MITVRVCDDYNCMALQAVDTDDLEVCEFSKKFRAKSIGVIGHLDPPRNQVYTHDYFKIIPKVLVYTMIIPGILARQGWIICETIYTKYYFRIIPTF